jgi:preprotein translocase subunit SecA
MLKNFVKLFSGDPTKKTVDQYRPLVEQVNALEAQFEALSDDALRAKKDEFKARVAAATKGLSLILVGAQRGGDDKAYRKAEQDALDEIMPEAFAAVREASKRTIGLRHYDVQIIGGAALHSGRSPKCAQGKARRLWQPCLSISTH